MEELEALEAILVVDAHEEVRRPDVVDPGDVFVSDAFDAMRAESDVVQRRTLHGLDGDGGAARMVELDGLSRRDGARGAHGGNERAEAEAQVLHDLERGRRRAVEMEAVVPELLELVQHAVAARRAQLPDLVVDLLDVRLRARSGHDLRPVVADLREPLRAHVLREDDQRAIAHARADPGPSDPEVPGGGEHERVLAGRALTLHLLLGQDRVGGTDLVRPRREVPAGEDDDGRPHARERLGQDGVRHAAVRLPGEVVEVERDRAGGRARRAPSRECRAGCARGRASPRTSVRTSSA